MPASELPDRAPGSARRAPGPPWRSGLLLVALGHLIALGGLTLSLAVGRWMGGERAAPEIIGRAAGYPVGLLGFVVAAEGLHRMLWWRPSRIPRWLRIVLSALATCAIGGLVGTIATAVVAYLTRA